jgi:PAS domain S-box-containing protein
VAALLRAHVSSTVDAAPRIDVAGTLAEALDLLNVCEYAAILLELNLPDSSGLATLDRILAAHPVAAVIVLTGVAGDDLGGEAVTRGAADYLPREEMTVRMLQRSIRYVGERVRRRGVEERYRDLTEEPARGLKRTFGALDDAVFTVTAADMIIDCNPSAESMFGYSREEFVGHSAKMLHYDDASFQRFREESVPSRTQCRMRRDGGALFHAEITVSLLHPQRGVEGGVVNVMRDITERVERGRQLRFQSALLEQVGQPVLAFDDEGRVTYWNRAAEEVTGMTRSDVVGRNAVELLSMEDDPEQTQTLREIAESAGVWHGEVRIRTKDGNVAIMQATATPAANADGSAGGRIATGVDITGLRRAEKESRRAAERLRRQAEMLEAVGQAVIGTDLEGRITYWNKAAAELYGWSGAEALGRKALGVTPSEASPRQAAEIFEVLRVGKAWTGESNVRRADGSTFCALVTDSPMVDKYGKLVGIIGLSTDISERKEMEERMRQAAKMEAVGRLAGGVAHDFNNLLTAIEGNASLVLEELDVGSSLRNDIEEIRTVGRRAASLTRQLLAFSRKQVLEERRVDVGRTALELKAMLDRLVPAPIEFRVEVGAEDLVVRVDPTQLQQVVINLVVNAIDATRDADRHVLCLARHRRRR